MKVYTKKANGRYESIGYQWNGFPTDGIWLVKDGSQNCIIQLGDIGKKPHRYLELAVHEEECSQYIIKKAEEAKGYSVVDMSRWAAEFYAGVLGQDV